MFNTPVPPLSIMVTGDDLILPTSPNIVFDAEGERLMSSRSSLTLPTSPNSFFNGEDVPGEGDLELQKSSRNPCSQVPLWELEKAATEFETRKMMLFGQTQKGTGFNPMTPSDLKSSAKGPEAEFEAEKDDLADAFFDFDDYADAALEVAETELAGGGSNDKLKDSLEDNEGLFGFDGWLFTRW